MLEAACREAKSLLLDQRLFLLDAEAYQIFEKQLEAPVEESLSLKAYGFIESPIAP